MSSPRAVDFTCTVEGFDAAISYQWGVMIFFRRYRIPLFDLANRYSLGTTKTKLSSELISLHLETKKQRADFYWLVRRGLVSLENQRLDTSARSIRYLQSQRLHSLAEGLITSVREVEWTLGVSSLPATTRRIQLERYGLCGKANVELLESSVANRAIENESFSRPKLATSRNGKPASADQCLMLLKSVLRKYQRQTSYEGFPLFRRVMPSAGSLCCVEAVLLRGNNCWLYDSHKDRLIELYPDPEELCAIHSDLWLNTGSVRSAASSTIILFAVQNPFASKYGELTSHLQAIDTGIVIADLWHMMSEYHLRGCILGNPMVGPLITLVRDFLGDVVTVSALMIFEA